MSWSRCICAALAALVLLGSGQAQAQQGDFFPELGTTEEFNVCNEDHFERIERGVGSDNLAGAALEACSIAKDLSCDGKTNIAEQAAEQKDKAPKGEREPPCWLRSLTHSLLDGAHTAAVAVPAYLMCHDTEELASIIEYHKPSTKCKGGGPLQKPTGLFLIILYVLLIGFTVILGRAALGMSALGDAWWFGVRSLVAITVISILVSPAVFGLPEAETLTGAGSLWWLFGMLLALSGGIGALIIDFVQSQHTFTQVTGHDFWFEGIRTIGWPGFHFALERMLDHLMHIMASVAIVARTLLPSISGIGEDLLKGIFTFSPDMVFNFLRFTIAATLIIAAVSFIVAFSITIAETVLTTAITIAMIPVLVVLWVFQATRGTFTAAMSNIAHAAVSMIIAGISISIAVVVTEVSMNNLVEGIQDNGGIQTAKSKESHIEEDIEIKYRLPLFGEFTATLKAYKGYPCYIPIDRNNDRSLRSAINDYLHLYACSGDGEEAKLVKTESHITGWLMAVLLFVAGIYTSKALLASASGISAEITGSRNVGGKVAQTILGAARKEGGKLAGLAKIGR